MSFTALVKDEVSRLELEETQKISLLSAIVQNNEYSFEKIRIVTENNEVARMIYSIFKDLFNVYPSVSVRKGYNYNKKMLYVLEVKNKLLDIFKSLGIKNDIPSEFIWADEDLIRSYLRGLFLVCASVNDPKTSRYHLEFSLPTKNYALFIQKLLNDFNLNSKFLHRDNRYVVYIKGAEKIGDFLRLIDAVKAVLYFEDIRIYRDHKNMTNRLNNCEQANVDRIIETANNQVKDIELIQSKGFFDLLGDKEKDIAPYRLKYPDASLFELSQIISGETGIKITKSGLYHRLHKIKDMANKIRKK
jgi:DNA-binding protein WhiA